MTTDIFDNDWRECLRAHYFHVVRERDKNNEQSLISVLKQSGFTDSDLAELRAHVLAELGWQDELAAELPAETPAASMEAEPEELAPVDVPAEVPEPIQAIEAEAEVVQDALPQEAEPVMVEPKKPDPLEPPKRGKKPPETPKQMSLF
jgi:hypothetical protein